MRRFAVMALVVLAGCAKISMDCPENGTVSIEVGGNQVGQAALMVGQAALGLGSGPPVLMAKAGASTAAAHVDYEYLAIFGTDHVTCTATKPQPIPIPLPVSVTPSAHG